MTYLLFIAGLAVLLVSAELLVRGAVALADRFGVPSLLIGLTVVAYGTSAPELAVAIGAVIDGAPSIAVGTVVGSNINNVLLVLGLPAVLFARALHTTPAARDVALMTGAGVLVLALARDGSLDRADGTVLLVLLVAYVLATYRWARRQPARPEALAAHERRTALRPARREAGLAAALVLAGAGGLWLGAELLVPAAIDVATALGVPPRVVGLVLVAIGTSLPELATAIVAAARGHADVALGTVVGSNIFRLLGILGVGCLIDPLPIAADVLRFDFWIMIAAAAAHLPDAWRAEMVGRKGGVALLGAYGAYVWLTFSGVSE